MYHNIIERAYPGQGKNLADQVGWLNCRWAHQQIPGHDPEPDPVLPEEGPATEMVEIWAKSSDTIREDYVPAYNRDIHWYDLIPRRRRDAWEGGWSELLGGGWVVLGKDGNYKFNEGGKR
jgi:hypothetical protein